MIARPFAKWVGGKRGIVTQIAPFFPTSFNVYHEPFVGGGAIFFHLRGLGWKGDAVLSDTNRRLMRCYGGIRDDVEDVIDLLRDVPYTREAYLEKREQFNAITAETADAEVAATFIILNKYGFNGLYRENRSGGFNVPFGRSESTPQLCDPDNLRACARALQGTALLCQDFRSAALVMKKGDFAYFDPPYVPVSVSANFTGYTAEGFDASDQADLRDTAISLKECGVQVRLSNSSAPFVRELYSGFEQIEVSARRSVNSDATKRGAVTELLLR